MSHAFNFRASGEELSCEAKLLSSELKKGSGENWAPDPALAETIGMLSQPGSDIREALQKLSVYLRMDGDIPDGLVGLDLLRKSKMCTAYALEKLDFAGHLLAFLKQDIPQDRAGRNMLRLQDEHQLFYKIHPGMSLNIIEPY